jgi:hypothetical protein
MHNNSRSAKSTRRFYRVGDTIEENIGHCVFSIQRWVLRLIYTISSANSFQVKVR